jgi:hypothetical protein
MGDECDGGLAGKKGVMCVLVKRLDGFVYMGCFPNGARRILCWAKSSKYNQ